MKKLFLRSLVEAVELFYLFIFLFKKTTTKLPNSNIFPSHIYKHLMNQAMATEDFSFPTITADSYPWSIDSPPLWHLSPATSPDVFHDKSMREREKGEKEDDDHYCFAIERKQRKSCSYIEKGSKMSRRVGNVEYGTEKMDLLWENFNEELSRSCSSRIDSGHMMGFDCAHPLKLSKTSGGMFSPKKPSVVVLFKSFRKLFLLHRSQHRG